MDFKKLKEASIVGVGQVSSFVNLFDKQFDGKLSDHLKMGWLGHLFLLQNCLFPIPDQNFISENGKITIKR